MGRLFTKKWKFLIFLGPHSHPSAPIDVKFCTAKRTQVPVGTAQFDLNRCNESPLRREKPDFWPVSKNHRLYRQFRYAAILPVIVCTYAVFGSNRHQNNYTKVVLALEIFFIYAANALILTYVVVPTVYITVQHSHARKT